MAVRKALCVSGVVVALLLGGCSQQKAPTDPKKLAGVCNNRSLAVALWGENGEAQPQKAITTKRRDMLQAVWSKPSPEPAYQVPKITHHIWYTSAEDPNEISDTDTSFIQASLMMTPLETGWKHYFWVNDPTLIPKTLEKLKPFDIEVKVINRDNIPGLDIFWQNAVEESQAIAKSMPADMLTYLILDHYGGVYLDTDYELANSLDELTENYSFFAFEEPGNQYIGHAIVASSPHHPVITEAEHLIKRNLVTPPDYIKNACSERAYTVLATGPAMFSVAFANKANLDAHYKDTFFPDDGSLSLVRYAFTPAIWSSQVGTHHGSNTWAKKDQDKPLAGCESCSSNLQVLNKANLARAKLSQLTP